MEFYISYILYKKKDIPINLLNKIIEEYEKQFPNLCLLDETIEEYNKRYMYYSMINSFNNKNIY